MLTVSNDGDEALRDGSLCCPVCQGPLRPWGWARTRFIRQQGGATWVRPRRARCRSCGRTQVLLPCRLLERRRDAVSDVGAILEAYAHGTGYRRVARDLSIPVATVRNWIRQLRGRWLLITARFAPGAASSGPPPPPAALGQPAADGLPAGLVAYDPPAGLVAYGPPAGPVAYGLPPGPAAADDPPAAVLAVRRAAAHAGWASTPWEFAAMRTNGGLLSTNTT